MTTAIIHAFFDQTTHTFSYVVADPKTKCCAIIDSVLDYDPASASTSTVHADQIIAYITLHQYTVQWILETHVHADHLTASQYLKQKLGGKIAISHKITMVQNTFSTIYHLDIKHFNSQQPFDYLFADHEYFNIGELTAYTLATPGHTPACLSYVIDDYAVFVGDTLFMPDYGTARCDFPKGSSSQLFDSIKKLYELPENMLVYLCHDYLPSERKDFVYQTDILTQKTQNIHLRQETKKSDFVAMRDQRDATLSTPKLMLPAIQVNLNAGQLPQPEANGIRYLKIPLNYFKA